MKKLVLFVIVVFFSLTMIAQGWRNKEMEIRVPLQSVEMARQLAGMKLNGDIYTSYAIMYVVPEELELLSGAGYDYEIRIADLNEHFRNFWETDEAYHSYQEIINLADSLATNFPAICKKVVFGTSMGGRQLAALKISDNVDIDESEAEVFFDGGIHGDEIGGPENLIRFARDLCLGYGTNTQITNLINGRETWLYLMVNPDGRVGMTRYNNNGEDLNRDCGYMWDQESAGSWSQVEIRVLRDAVLSNQFVVYTSYHSGTEFISHPWSYRASFSPDHPHVNHLASVYADVSGYTNIPYGPGYTGMYPINGSTKDASYGIQGSVSWSMEISMDKQPPASQIMLYYNYNKPAMLAMMDYAGYGLAGFVTDETTGEPVAATVFVNNSLPSYSDPEVGDYYKYVIPGTYTITVKANGYQTKVVSGVVVTANNTTTTNFQLTPEDHQNIYKVIACQIPGNNSSDEGATWAAIGQPDNINYSIGKSGWIIVDMQEIIFDGAGADVMVIEGDATPEGFTLYAGAGIDGPWYTMGTGTGTTEFSFENCVLSEARYFKIVDDGNGTANVADAGFELDAMAALSAVTGPYIVMEGYEVNDFNGNNNGILEPGETADYIITLKNIGSETALNIIGALTCNDPYITVLTGNPQNFGDIPVNGTAIATYTVSATAGAPAGHTATLNLTITGSNITTLTKTIEIVFPDYCEATTSTEDEYIANVNCGEINNSSGWQGGVANYTNLSVNIDPGASKPITVTNGNAWASDIVYVWVDWNNDFELGNASGETFQLTNVGGTGQTFTGNISVPAGQQGGMYRMRIRMTYSTAPTPCGSATYGEVEDYTVNVTGSTLIAAFTSDVTDVCAGGQVHFYDNSTGNITSWSWEFPSGNPASSTLQNPVVTYNTAGNFGVTLTVSDGTNNNTITALEYILVMDPPEVPDQPVGATEICQDAPDGTYTSGGASNVTGWIWQLDPSQAGIVMGNGPTGFVNWNASFSGTAYLKVKTSNVCGESNWSDELIITVLPLPSAAGSISGDDEVCQGDMVTYTVLPVGDATDYEWMIDPAAAGTMSIALNECTITWSDSWLGQAGIKVRGANDCGPGAWSDIFLVMVQNCIGISDPENISEVDIWPNPNDGKFVLKAPFLLDEKADILVYDATGLKVLEIQQAHLFSQIQGTELNLRILKPGMYYLKINTESGTFVKKIIIQQ